MSQLIIESIRKIARALDKKEITLEARVSNTKAIKPIVKWIRGCWYKGKLLYPEMKMWKCLCIIAKNAVFIPFIRVFIRLHPADLAMAGVSG